LDARIMNRRPLDKGLIRDLVLIGDRWKDGDAGSDGLDQGRCRSADGGFRRH